VSGPIGSELEARIRDAIGDFPEYVLDTGTQPRPMVIKYMPARFGKTYHRPGQKLKISEVRGFTWGQATYVTPLAFPLSSGVCGRVGVVARFEFGRWKTFDATKPENEQLYLAWLQRQPMFKDLMLTAHSAYLSQLLRDEFRRKFKIDCVLFRPDQSNRNYTSTRDDVWMAVSDWRRMPSGERTLADGFSERFIDPRLTVVLEEEFEDQMGGIHRAGLLELGGPRPAGNLAEEIWHAYNMGRIVRIPS